MCGQTTRFLARLFSRLFNYLYFRNVYRLKILTITYICRPMRRYCACFHWTSSIRWPNDSIFTQQQFFCSIFLTKIKLHSTSLDSTLTRWPNGSIFCSMFFRGPFGQRLTCVHECFYTYIYRIHFYTSRLMPR